MPRDVDSRNTVSEDAGTGEHEAPPFLGRWRNLYLVVLGWLAVLIILFYRFTEYFS